MLEKIIAGILLILLSPFLLIIYILVRTSSKGPFIFKQLRAGKDKKPFYIYKIRTMIENAESLKNDYQHLNEADGPVFKIRNDPRYTKIGKILSPSGLDELPQLINIVKGEMAFVGPRPFPLAEAHKVDPKYKKRFTILPGITSPAVIHKTHKQSFVEWMKSDLRYVEKKSFLLDLYISYQTLVLIIKSIFNIK